MSNSMPGPWEYDTDIGGTFMVFPSNDPNGEALVCRGIKNEADAKLIVRCVNSHGALVDALAAAAPKYGAQPAQAVPSDVERDAARYRWLRNCSNAIDWDADIRVPPMPASWWETATGGDQLDAAIDAAIARLNPVNAPEPRADAD